MAYFIFRNNSDGETGTIFKIAENESDLNNLNILKSDYKIIEDSQSNFNEVKFGLKYPISYNNNTITYISITLGFDNKLNLDKYILNFKDNINNFLQNNKNHPLFQKWNDYFTQLNNLNTSTLSYPIAISLEEYFKNETQTSLSPLQLP